MSKRMTVALRICMQCGDGYGVVLWPWSGEAMTRTHGVCGSCFETLDTAFDDERRERPDAATPVADPGWH